MSNSQDVTGLDLNRCVKVHYQMLYTCGECLPGETVIKEVSFKKSSCPVGRKITSIAELGHKDEIVYVGRPCKPNCPYAKDPQPH